MEALIMRSIPYFTTKVPFKKVAEPIDMAKPANMKGNSSFKPYCVGISVEMNLNTP